MSSPTADDDRILSRLLHDVRTPLGVAHGYLRMIRDERLPAPEQRARALDGVINALSQMTRLCDQAAGRAPIEMPPAAKRQAAAFADELAALLPALGIACTIEGRAPSSVLQVDHVDAVREATILLIHGVVGVGGACILGLDASTLVVRRRQAEGTTTLLTLPLETAPA